jgi:hypothetical protein
MRSSSVKTMISTLVIVTSLTVGTPSAAARPTQQPRETTAVRGEPRVGDRVARVVRRIVTRLLGTNDDSAFPSPPTPAPSGGN